MIGIYKITNPKGESYIGQSINVHKRMSQYKKLGCADQTRIFNSLKKYGVNNHTFDVICECEQSELNEKERYYQELFNVIEKGLNCRLTKTKNKEGFFSEETKTKMSLRQLGRVVSEETRLKLSKSKKGTFIGSANPFFNKTHTEELRAEMSRVRKGTRIGLENVNSKLILDINTGVFYYSVNDLCKYSKYSKGYLSEILRGSKRNKTQYIYV